MFLKLAALDQIGSSLGTISCNPVLFTAISRLIRFFPDYRPTAYKTTEVDLVSLLVDLHIEPCHIVKQSVSISFGSCVSIEPLKHSSPYFPGTMADIQRLGREAISHIL